MDIEITRNNQTDKLLTARKHLRYLGRTLIDTWINIGGKWN